MEHCNATSKTLLILWSRLIRSLLSLASIHCLRGCLKASGLYEWCDSCAENKDPMLFEIIILVLYLSYIWSLLILNRVLLISFSLPIYPLLTPGNIMRFAHNQRLLCIKVPAFSFRKVSDLALKVLSKGEFP